MVGHFPPSSSVTGVRCFDAAPITSRPTRVLPVKKIVSNFSRSNPAAVVSSPCTTAMNSGGKISPIRRAIAAAVWGANSDGFKTAQLPAEMAPTNGPSSNCKG